MAQRAEAKSDGQKLVGYWLDQLDQSEKWQRNWLHRSRRLVRRYKNIYRNDTTDGESSTNDDTAANGGVRRFAILWSNMETLKPAVYTRAPKPIVSRRYKDADPVGKVVAEVLERSLDFAIDTYDFDERMQLCRDDYLLLARGQVWVRYIPHVGKVGADEAGPEEEESEGQITNDQDGEGEADVVTYQEVVCDHVAYDDWGMQPCRNWAETGYVWRRAYLTRKQCVERFGKVGAKIPLDWKPKTEESRDSQSVDEHKAQIYEIWDKASGQAIWLSRGYTADVLDARPDPLGLKDFFPCPRPLMGTTPQDAYLPVADFIYYQDQAEEVDELSQRIGRMIDALRMVGVYASENGVDLSNMFAGDTNKLIPINGYQTLADKGGLKGIIEWMPVDMVIETLKACIETRRQMLDDIYQITGISDIIRGDSDPNETATAQRLKGQWGSLRVRDKQRELARFARDILDMKGQIISSKFEMETLKAQTDVKLLTNAEKQQIQQQQALQQQAAQISAQQGVPAPPAQPIPGADLLDQPSWEDVISLMRDKALLQFRIDIETDSTIEPDEAAAKQSFVEYVGALSQLLTVASTIVPGAPYTAPLFGEIAKQSARIFNVSPTLEDVIDKVFSQAEQQPPTAPQGQAAGPSGPSPQELQIKQQDVQGSHQLEAANIQAQQADSQQSHALEGAKLQLQMQEQSRQHDLDAANLELKSRELDLKRQALARDPKPQSVT